MSANPQPRPLVTGDLDLLISRSLDGDLPGEEERELQSLLAADPAARARYEAMAALVGRLEALPDPDSPFALTTRVSSQVDADTRGVAASLHRFGFFFRPATLGLVAAGIVLFIIVSTVTSPPKPATTVAVAKPQPAQAPDDGRVTVFFGESKAKDAAPSAAPATSVARQAGLSETRANEAKKADPSGAGPRGGCRSPAREGGGGLRPRARRAGSRGRRSRARCGRPLATQRRRERRGRERDAEAVASEATRLRASAPQAAGSVHSGGNVEVVGKAAGTLRLASPFRLDGLAGPFEGTYRLELDASGRVTDVARLFGGSGSGAVRPDRETEECSPSTRPTRPGARDQWT